MRAFAYRFSTAIAAASLVAATPATAQSTASPWIAFSAFASPTSAAQLKDRPACRTKAEIEAAADDRRAGRVSQCILAQSRVMTAQKNSRLLQTGSGLTTVPLLLGLSATLGATVAAMGGGNSTDALLLRPLSPP